MLIFGDGVHEEDLDVGFTAKLISAWGISGVPYFVTSGYRKGDGPHGTRKAADIRCGDSRSRLLIMRGLLAAGFSRVGIGSIKSPHIHVDMCDGAYFDSDVLWLE